MRPVLLKTLLILFFMAGILGFTGGTGWAIPSSQSLYQEYDLGGGLWRYDYTLYNTSDPVENTGYNLYDFFLYFDSTVTLSVILSPADWDFNSNESPPASGNYHDFIDWFSTLPGEPPTGADIAPGGFLGGFSLTSDTRLASLSYDVFLTNPDPTLDPVLYSGNTASVPEPSTVLLIGSGLIGLAGLRRRFSKN